MKSKDLPIIGRYADAQFPLWEGVWSRAKIDTGAAICSIHAENVYEKEQDGVKTLFFSLTRMTDAPRGPLRTIHCQSVDYSIKKAKSALGEDWRYCVETVIQIEGREYPVTIGLSDRSRMRMPFLLGLKLIRGNFLVDLSQ